MVGIFRLIVKTFRLLVERCYPEAFVFAVLTNKPMVRAYCGLGGPQAVFGTESLMVDLAEAPTMDPLATRLNSTHPLHSLLNCQCMMCQ